MIPPFADSNDHPNLPELPADLKKEIAKFLPPEDVLRMARCCKLMKEDVTLSQISVLLTENFGSYIETSKPLIIPIVHNRTHSICIQLTSFWYSFERNERHVAKLIVLAERKHDHETKKRYCGRLEEFPSEICPDNSFSPCERRTVLKRSMVTSTSAETARVSFVPRQDEMYFLSITGISCSKQVKIHINIFDDEERHFRQNYLNIVNHSSICRGVFGGRYLYRNMLSKVTQSLRNHLVQGSDMDSFLVAYLQTVSISMELESLWVIEAVKNFLLEYILNGKSLQMYWYFRIEDECDDAYCIKPYCCYWRPIPRRHDGKDVFAIEVGGFTEDNDSVSDNNSPRFWSRLLSNVRRYVGRRG